MFAILLVLLAEILAETLLFRQHLDEHDRKERYPHNDCLPRPEPDAERSEVRERAGEHRVAVDAVRTVNHQVLRTRTDFFAESVHRVALAAGLHIYNRPDA